MLQLIERIVKIRALYQFSIVDFSLNAPVADPNSILVSKNHIYISELKNKSLKIFKEGALAAQISLPTSVVINSCPDGRVLLNGLENGNLYILNEDHAISELISSSDIFPDAKYLIRSALALNGLTYLVVTKDSNDYLLLLLKEGKFSILKRYFSYRDFGSLQLFSKNESLFIFDPKNNQISTINDSTIEASISCEFSGGRTWILGPSNEFIFLLSNLKILYKLDLKGRVIFTLDLLQAFGGNFFGRGFGRGIIRGSSLFLCDRQNERIWKMKVCDDSDEY